MCQQGAHGGRWTGPVDNLRSIAAIDGQGQFLPPICLGAVLRQMLAVVTIACVSSSCARLRSVRWVRVSCKTGCQKWCLCSAVADATRRHAYVDGVSLVNVWRWAGSPIKGLVSTS